MRRLRDIDDITQHAFGAYNDRTPGAEEREEALTQSDTPWPGSALLRLRDRCEQIDERFSTQDIVRKLLVVRPKLVVLTMSADHAGNQRRTPRAGECGEDLTNERFSCGLGAEGVEENVEAQRQCLATAS